MRIPDFFIHINITTGEYLLVFVRYVKCVPRCLIIRETGMSS